MFRLNSLFLLCITLFAFLSLRPVVANPDIVREAAAPQDKQTAEAAEGANAAEHWGRGRGSWGRGWGGYGYGYPGYYPQGYGFYNPYLYY